MGGDVYRGKEKGDYRNFYRKLFYKCLIKRFCKDCSTAIDVGAGSGLFYDVAKHYLNVVGIDLVPSRPEIIRCDFRSWIGTTDLLFNSQFIEHVDQGEFMSFVRRCCKKVFITITTRPCESFWNSPDHIRPYTKRTIEVLCVQVGFSVVFSMNLWPTDSFVVVARKRK